MDGGLFPGPEDEPLPHDMLRGAAAIAEFLYGSESDRRKVFHLVATSRLPTFKLGGLICARRSVLRQWIADQETRNSKGIGKPPSEPKDPKGKPDKPGKKPKKDDDPDPNGDKHR